jgi:hypothetical protein
MLSSGVLKMAKANLMNIAIVGAGIYGCHLALALRKQGFHVSLYEASNDIFTGASTFNSFRIHKGYHYPRSSKTREMCIRDEKKFSEHYPHLISDAEDNPKIFCVADDENTLMDFNTMKIIMKGAGLPFDELSQDELQERGFAQVDGGFRVNESIFLVDKAKSWFKQQLMSSGVRLKLNTYVEDITTIDNNQVAINGKTYDYVINCTYNQALQYCPVGHNHYYDLCFSLIVASKQSKEHCDEMSFGVFDGAYPSLEPYGYAEIPEQYYAYADKKLFQLFHVKYTSLNHYTDIKDARETLSLGLSKEALRTQTQLILEHTKTFYPMLAERFEVIGYNLALKTKVRDLSDSRPLIVLADAAKHPSLIQVFSSKLTSIFSAEEQVMKLIDANSKCETLKVA